MTTKSVTSIEKLHDFIAHLVELNRLHAPDDESLDHILDAEAGEAKRSRSAIATIYRAIPHDESAPHVAAFLVRSFAVMQPFNGANVRTAVDYVYEWLERHRLSFHASSMEVDELANQIWDSIGQSNGSLDRANLHAKDGLHKLIFDWFHARVH